MKKKWLLLLIAGAVLASGCKGENMGRGQAVMTQETARRFLPIRNAVPYQRLPLFNPFNRTKSSILSLFLCSLLWLD